MLSISRRAVVGTLATVLAALVLAAAPPPARAAAPSGAESQLARAGVDAAEVLARRSRGLAPSSSLAVEWPADAVPGSLLVTTEAGAAAPLSQAAAAGRLDGLRATGGTELAARVARVEVAAGEEVEAAQALRGRPGVIAVEPDMVRHSFAVPNDPRYPEQHAHAQAGIEQAWDTTTGSTDVTVAVIDSGMVGGHPDLAGLVVEQVDTTSGEVVPSGQNPMQDNDPCLDGHGTQVAGIIGARGNNATDVAGVNHQVSFLDISANVKAEDCQFSGAFEDAAIIAGIDHATSRGVDVINMSLGGPSRSCSTAFQTSLDAARAQGILIVASSGNAGEGDINVPASCNGVVSVSATGPTEQVASYASTNRWVDLTAPGGDELNGDGLVDAAEGVLTTSVYNLGEVTESVVPVVGTSFSGPYVAGVAALLRAANPALTPDQLEAILEGTARDLGPAGRDDLFGFGNVDPTAALAAAAGEAPALVPDPAFPVGSSAGVRLGGEIPGDLDVSRISAMTGTTEPISQGVATSQQLFPDAASTVPEDEPFKAVFGVLARADDFADALAGSSGTFGAAPLLFTPSTGGLDPTVGAELTRALQPGSQVIILGGVAAIPAQVDDDLRALGFEPLRLFGPTREHTAVAIANEVLAFKAQGGQPTEAAILVSRSVWFDAITAGSLAAGFQFPIFLTPSDELAEPTRAALEGLDVETLYVVGGEVRVSQRVRTAAAEAAAPNQTVVLAGASRDETAVKVGGEVERLLGEFGFFPPLGLALNLTRDQGYAYALAAAPLLAQTGSVFVGVTGDDGSEVSTVTQDYVRGFAIPIVGLGDVDVITDDSLLGLEQLLETIPEG